MFCKTLHAPCQILLRTRFTTHTNSVLTSTDFNVAQNSIIIKKLNSNKARGHDKIRTYAETMWRFNKQTITNSF